MAEVTVTLPPGVGLHARPAAMFVQQVTAAPVAVTVGRPGQPGVDAKSILAVMGLGAKAGEDIVLSAQGDGAEDVLASLKTMLETPEE
jgi:phosphocarrier protein